MSEPAPQEIPSDRGIFVVARDQACTLGKSNAVNFKGATGAAARLVERIGDNGIATEAAPCQQGIGIVSYEDYAEAIVDKLEARRF